MPGWGVTGGRQVPGWALHHLAGRPHHMGQYSAGGSGQESRLPGMALHVYQRDAPERLWKRRHYNHRDGHLLGGQHKGLCEVRPNCCGGKGAAQFRHDRRAGGANHGGAGIGGR